MDQSQQYRTTTLCRSKQTDYLNVRLRRMVQAVLEIKLKNIPETKLDFLSDSKKPLYVRCVSCLAILVCLLLFVYQAYDRVKFYLELPVGTEVYMTKKMHQTFPDMTVCYQPTHGMYQAIRNRKNQDICSTFPTDAAITNRVYSLNKIWELMNTSTAIVSAESVMRGLSKNLSYSEIPLLTGTCATFKFDYRGLMDIDAQMKIVFQYNNTKCEYPTSTLIYVHDSEEFPVLRHEHELRVGVINEISIAIRKEIGGKVSLGPIAPIGCGWISQWLVYQRNFVTGFFSELFGLKRFPFYPPAVNLQTCNTTERSYKVEWHKARASMVGKIATEICDCPRKCLHRTFEERINPIVGRTNHSSYVLKFGDPHETEIRERLIYDIIKLLSDIGGSSGLFIGLSLLSIFQFFQTFRRSKKSTEFSATDPLYLKVLKTFNKIEKNATSMSDNTKHHLSICRSIVLVMCATTFTLAVFYRTYFFIQQPMRSVVRSFFNSTFDTPTITICTANHGVLKLQRHLAKKNYASDSCEVKFWDLLSLPMVSTNEFWPTGDNECRGYSWISCKRVLLPTEELCYDFNQTNLQVPASYFIWIRSVQPALCGTNYHKVYIKSATGYYDFFRYRYIFDDSKQQLSFVVKEIRFDGTSDHCTSENNHEFCKHGCLMEKLWKQINCRLPYMPSYNLPLCNSSSTAKLSHQSYQDLFILPGRTDDCNCLPPCIKTFYETSITTAKKDEGYLTVSFGSSHNMVESYTKIPKYPIEALLCDIGSWFGAVMGLCILDIFDKLLESATKMKWCQRKNDQRYV